MVDFTVQQLVSIAKKEIVEIDVLKVEVNKRLLKRVKESTEHMD